MSKILKRQVQEQIMDEDIWHEDNLYEDGYWENYWDEVTNGEMSWQWYMQVALAHQEGWKYVVVNPIHKAETVMHWINNNYPDCTYKRERNHFLINDSEIATMVALRWA